MQEGECLSKNQAFNGFAHESRLGSLAQESGSLLSLLQVIFEDNFLYNNPDMKKLIAQDPKGFVSIKQIMALPSFTDFVQKNPSAYFSEFEIERCVNKQSKKLMCRNQRVRRINPFIDKIKNGAALPLYFQNFPLGTKFDEIYSAFSEVTRICQLYVNLAQRWGIVYAENHQLLERLDGVAFHWEAPLRIYKPESSLKNYSTFQKMSNDYKYKKLYQNNDIFSKQHYFALSYDSQALIQEQMHEFLQQYPKSRSRKIQHFSQTMSEFAMESEEMEANCEGLINLNQSGLRERKKLKKRTQALEFSFLAKMKSEEDKYYKRIEEMYNIDNTALFALHSEKGELMSEADWME